MFKKIKCQKVIPYSGKKSQKDTLATAMKHEST